ncbi:MAG: hypothetical protein COA58_00220 [Bacteroidetes bacterium]|nr:MAG: hypothetical protein COA58_00220 [Bacteroidota bacterium]
MTALRFFKKITLSILAICILYFLYSIVAGCGIYTSYSESSYNYKQSHTNGTFFKNLEIVDIQPERYKDSALFEKIWLDNLYFNKEYGCSDFLKFRELHPNQHILKVIPSSTLSERDPYYSYSKGGFAGDNESKRYYLGIKIDVIVDISKPEDLTITLFSPEDTIKVTLQ